MDNHNMKIIRLSCTQCFVFVFSPFCSNRARVFECSNVRSRHFFVCVSRVSPLDDVHRRSTSPPTLKNHKLETMHPQLGPSVSNDECVDQIVALQVSAAACCRCVCARAVADGDHSRHVSARFVPDSGVTPIVCCTDVPP